MRRSLPRGVPVLLAGLAAACESSGVAAPENATPGDDALATVLADASRDGRPRGGGSLFDRLALEIPGFGGLYRTEPCSIVVVLTDMSQEAHALRVVHAAVAPLVARPCGGDVGVTAERGRFTYVQLQRFLAASRPLLAIDGVLGASLDYALNGLVIVVASREAAQAVTRALPRTGIPPEAVVFVRRATRRTSRRSVRAGR